MVKGSDLNLVRCSSRMKKLKTCTDLDSLPEELLMQILLHVPAQDLFDAAKFVSRRWLSIIKTHNFRLTHLHNSSSGLLIKHEVKSEHSFVSMTRAGQIETSALISHNPIKRGFWSSCNGLLLEPNFTRELMITNPVTKRSLQLPPFISRTHFPDFLSALAFVPSRMEYKVVRTYYNRTPPYNDPYHIGFPDRGSRIYCGMLTVGVDKSWRIVDTEQQHLSLAESRLLNSCPLVTGSFVHWVQDFTITIKRDYVISFTKSSDDDEMVRNIYFLTMNMETEIITQCLAPARWNESYCEYKYLSGGIYLSLLIGRRCGLKWEVWEMEPKTREWRKVRDIDLEGHEGLLNQLHDRFKDEDFLDCKLKPAGWLEYGSVIIFVVYMKRRGYFFGAGLRAAYNVQTRDISLFDDLNRCNPYLVHTNSLMWPFG